MSTRRSHPLAFGRKAYTALLAPLAILLVVTGILLAQLHRLSQLTQWVEHADRIIAKANAIHALVGDYEAGARGFVLTGKRSFLEPQQRARESLQIQVPEFTELIRDNPLQLRRWSAFRDTLALWQDELRIVMDMKLRGQHPETRVAEEGGKRLRDTIRAQLTEIVNTEEGLRDERSRAAREFNRRLFIGVILLMTLAGVVFIVHTRRQLGLMERLYTEALRREEHRRIALERIQKELEANLRAKDEFLAICSHELKTPVTSMQLQQQMTLRRIERGDAAVFDAREIEQRTRATLRQILRLGKLIADILDVTAFSSGRLEIEHELVDLAACARAVVDRFGPDFAAAGATLSLEATPEVLVRGDAARIEQALASLLSNSLRYGARNPVKMILRGTDDRARIEVIDQGIGMAAAQLHRLFQRYERGVPSSEVSGLGVGLYIAKAIVEAHGGQIHASSELGRGSTFTIEFPRAARRSKVRPGGDPDTGANDGNTMAG